MFLGDFKLPGEAQCIDRFIKKIYFLCDFVLLILLSFFSKVKSNHLITCLFVCLFRIMEAFAGHLFDYLGAGKPFANADAAYILAFSTIMLNTDLHNQQIPLNKKMTK